MNWKKTLLISLGILLIAAGVVYVIFRTEPTAQRESATKETAMLVEVTEGEFGNFRPVIKATGVVQAEQDIMLSPRINGEIIWRSAKFSPGTVVRKGEVLLRLDPTDYQNVLDLRKADLQQAISDLELEMGRQDIAKKDYQLFNDSLPAANKALVLRQPQLKAAQAVVDAAKVAVQQAELDLERTTIKAPFDAQVLSREANLGSQVVAGQSLGRLVGVDEYWVAVSLPVNELQWIEFPDARNRGSVVRVQSRSGWREDQFREGRVDRLVGALDDQTRLATVLVSIRDPLVQQASGSQPPLIIGAFVEVHIEARELQDVVRLSRDYLRQGNKVWIMADGQLIIRDVDVVTMDEDFVYIKSGLAPGENVVMTNLSTITPGAKLRIEESESKVSAPATEPNN